MISTSHHTRHAVAARAGPLLAVAALIVAGQLATPQPTPVAGAPSLPADPAAAQATSTPPPTPTRYVPRFEPPPRALLTVGGETQEAGISAYCWDGTCQDF